MPPDEHTLVTATRADTSAVRPDGTVHEARLTELTQLAVDDVLRRLHLQQQPVHPHHLVVDVRVTAFVPAGGPR